jgi:hypothetical protein
MSFMKHDIYYFTANRVETRTVSKKRRNNNNNDMTKITFTPYGACGIKTGDVDA